MPSVTRSVSVSGDLRGPVSNPVTITAEGQINLEVAIADSTSNKQVVFAVDVSEVKYFSLLSTVAMTVETNDGTTPDNTFTLAANVAYIFPVKTGESWTDTEDGAVSTDITDLYVTNASGADGTLYVDCLVDPTP